MDLVPYESVAQIAEVLGFGAQKYDAHNWRKGIAMSRLIAAAERHIGQFKDGEDRDPESGLSHLAHAGCCVLFALWMYTNRPDLDDRWKPEVANVLRVQEQASDVEGSYVRDVRAGAASAAEAHPKVGPCRAYAQDDV
jgi:hypothetical protein